MYPLPVAWVHGGCRDPTAISLMKTLIDVSVLETYRYFVGSSKGLLRGMVRVILPSTPRSLGTRVYAYPDPLAHDNLASNTRSVVGPILTDTGSGRSSYNPSSTRVVDKQRASLLVANISANTQLGQ